MIELQFYNLYLAFPQLQVNLQWQHPSPPKYLSLLLRIH